MRTTTAVRAAALSLAAVAASALAASPSSPLQPVTGTLALYQFDEGSGTAVADSSGNGRNATLTGNYTWGPGLSGSALTFTAGGYVQAPAIPVGSTWTAQAWTRFPLGPIANGWWTFMRNGGGHHHIIVQTDGVLGVFVNGFYPSKTPGNTDFNVNTIAAGWHLLTAVASANKTTFFIDAAQVSQSPVAETNPVNNIGSAGSDSQPWGTIDSVRIMNVARSAQDIASDSNPLPATPSSLHQIDPYTQAEIVAGATLARPAVRIQATVSSPTNAMVGLVAELEVIGKDFDGLDVNTSAMVPSGGVATISLTGLAYSQSYHWRIQAIDDAGRQSAWVSYGGNAETAKDFGTPPPPAPPTLTQVEQKDPGTNSPVGSGGSFFDTDGVRITATPVDPGNDQVVLEAEIVPAGMPFRNSATATSAVTASGSSATVDIDGLAPGGYVWQARGVSVWGVAGAWTPAGGSPDMVVVGHGSGGHTFADAFSAGGCSAAGVGASLLLLALIPAAALLRRS